MQVSIFQMPALIIYFQYFSMIQQAMPHCIVAKKTKRMKKILLIEDNANILENNAEILELAGYKVLTATDGKAGVEIAFNEFPDLIICDIMMPVLDGYAVLHMLQKNSKTRNIPFIFLTAKTEKSDMRKGMDLGADDYITKPFSGTDLLNAVESRLRKAGMIKEDLTSGPERTEQLIGITAGNEAMAQLTKGRNINRYKRKQIIYHEGNRPACLFFVQKGKIKTFKANEDGKELVLDLYNEGDFVGYAPLLENSNYKESAEAMDAAELAIIPREEFEFLVTNNPAISKKFMQLLAKNVADKEVQLLGIAYNSLRKKVAEALIAVHKKYNGSFDENFSIDLSRDNLAGIAATAKESFIRTLSDFRNEKLIDIHEGTITILNVRKLANLLN